MPTTAGSTVPSGIDLLISSSRVFSEGTVRDVKYDKLSFERAIRNPKGGAI